MTAPPCVPDIKISLTSGALAVRQALANMLDALRPLALDDDETGTVELVLAEAMNNIVEHAYPEGDAPGPINVTCRPQTGGLCFEIQDCGRPMPEGKTPVGLPVDLDVEVMDVPEGGFGWFLIKELAKDVVYHRIDNTNQLTFRLALAN